MPLPGFHHSAIKLGFLWMGLRREHILKATPNPVSGDFSAQPTMRRTQSWMNVDDMQ